MATVATRPTANQRVRPGRRFDHFFFSGMSLLILATVFIGFSRTYYLAGMIQAPLPSPIIHIHGAAFSLWVLLLVAQTSLVSAGKVGVHRRLGIAGFLLAGCMVILGIGASTNSLARGFAPPGLDPVTFYVVPISDMLIFSILIFFAFRNRLDSPAHKRLILIATVALLIAAIARWPFALVHLRPIPAMMFSYIFLILLAGYDWWSMGRLHRVTLWGCGFLIVVQQARVPFGQTAAWHAIVHWATGL
jgi:hypothetical protein